MPRRSHRRSTHQDGAPGVALLIVGALVYQQLSALSVPWTIALAVLGTSLTGTTVIGVVRASRRRQKQRLLLANALSLTPDEFETRIQYLLHDLGWENVERSGGSGDGGVDLRGVDRGQHCIVQCKRFSGRVEPKYIRELHGARHHERADRALLITTGHFTKQGYAWARGKPIELWDGAFLAERFQEQQQRLQNPERQQRDRRRTWWLLGGLATVNALVLVWAATSAPIFAVPAAIVAEQPARSAASHTAPTPALPVHAPAAPAMCGQATISGVERLVLRDAPGLHSTKLADYPAGTTVLLQCDEPITIDGLVWQLVRVAGQDGWMSRRMLK